MKFKLNRGNSIILIGTVLIIAIMIFPTIISSAYSVLVADDFSAGSMFRKGYTGLNYLKYYYQGWQGTYTGLLLIPLLSPIAHNGLESLRLITVITTTLMYASYIYLVDSFIKFLYETVSIYLRAAISILAVFAITSFMSYFEVIYWFTGIAVYTIPMIACMVGLGLILRHNNLDCVRLAIVGLLGVIAGGGALAIPGFGCYVFLIIISYNLYKNKRIQLSRIVAFIIWLTGALVNALAPGNYVRHNVVDETGVHPVQGIITAIKICVNRLTWLNTSTGFYVVILVLLIAGIIFLPHKEKIQKEYIIFHLLSLVAPVITIFPVALGQGENTPNRVLFVLDISLYVSSILLVIFVANLLNVYVIDESHKKVVATIMAVIAASCAANNNSIYSDNAIYQVSAQLVNGDYDNYYHCMAQLYDKFEKCEQGTEVIVMSSELPQDIPNYKNFYLDLDPQDWVNIDISNYYGFNSITLIEE